ncbi:carboxymuconolactone decarboxylase family protein [Pseudomonas sp. SDO55104_S430]
MTRTIIPTRDSAQEEARPALDLIFNKMGFVPNVLRLTSLSLNALEALEEVKRSLNDSFDEKVRVLVALVVSEENSCLYCLAAHTYIGMNFGKIYPADLLLARLGISNDPKMEALGKFVKKVVTTRGHVAELELTRIREIGFTDMDILTVIGLITQYTFFNYVNNVFDTKIDFPKVDVFKTFN